MSHNLEIKSLKGVHMFSGSIVAIVTPFTPNGDIDNKALGNIIEKHIAAGTSAIVPCGTTGEAPVLTTEEHRFVIGRCVDISAGRIPVIAGIGSNSTRQSVEMTSHAKRCKCDAVMAVTPYYNKPTQSGCIAHFTAIADVGLPLVLYNHPGRTGTKLTTDTIVKLAKHKNIVAIKEATADVSTAMDIIHNSNITVLCGDDNLVIPFMSVGASGIISVVANIIPEVWATMVHDYKNGKTDKALATSYLYRDLCNAIFSENNPQGIKYAMSLLGICSPSVRLPLVESSATSKELMHAALANLKMLNSQQ